MEYGPTGSLVYSSYFGGASGPTGTTYPGGVNSAWAARLTLPALSTTATPSAQHRAQR